MEKYYTPTIDEFHVGFEYEVATNNEFGLSIESATWRKQTFSLESVVITNFDRDVMAKGILFPKSRVKYLDSADVDSLGWIFVSESESIFEFKHTIPYDYEGTDYELRWHLTLYKDERTVIIHNNKMWDQEVVIFHGIINNKNELQKLMKQLKLI